MPVNLRHIVPFVLVGGICLLTLSNIRLYSQTSQIKAENRMLILQQDSIMSVHINLTKEVLDMAPRMVARQDFLREKRNDGTPEHAGVSEN